MATSEHDQPDDTVDDELDTGLEAGAEGEEGGADEAAGEEHDEGESSVKRDTELEEAHSDEQREEIRNRRREDRRNKAKRQRDKIDALVNERNALIAKMQALEQNVATLNNNALGQALTGVDAEINKTKQAIAHFQRVKAEALTKSDGNTATQADNYLQAARDRIAQLTVVKNNATANANRPPPLDPAMVSKATEFAKKNAWYGGPNSPDPDSKVMTTLDTSLTAEGWDPRSDAYWQELERRKAKYLPHRAEQQRQEPRQQSRSQSSVAGSSSGTGASNGSANKGEYRISPEKVQAIKDAGAWNDPKQRAEYIKAYRDYDTAQRK